MRPREIRLLDLATQAPVDFAYIARRDSSGAWRVIAQADANGRAVVTVPDGTRLRFERVGYAAHEQTVEEGPRFYLEGGVTLPEVVVSRPAKGSGAGWFLLAALVAVVVLER